MDIAGLQLLGRPLLPFPNHYVTKLPLSPSLNSCSPRLNPNFAIPNKSSLLPFFGPELPTTPTQVAPSHPPTRPRNTTTNMAVSDP